MIKKVGILLATVLCAGTLVACG
ncbi:hypothetical protein SCS_02859, partial [Enterococcus faecalis EnGen0117]